MAVSFHTLGYCTSIYYVGLYICKYWVSTGVLGIMGPSTQQYALRCNHIWHSLRLGLLNHTLGSMPSSGINAVLPRNVRLNALGTWDISSLCTLELRVVCAIAIKVERALLQFPNYLALHCCRLDRRVYRSSMPLEIRTCSRTFEVNKVGFTFYLGSRGRTTRHVNAPVTYDPLWHRPLCDC